MSSPPSTEPPTPSSPQSTFNTRIIRRSVHEKPPIIRRSTETKPEDTPTVSPSSQQLSQTEESPRPVPSAVTRLNSLRSQPKRIVCLQNKTSPRVSQDVSPATPGTPPFNSTSTSPSSPITPTEGRLVQMRRIQRSPSNEASDEQTSETKTSPVPIRRTPSSPPDVDKPENTMEGSPSSPLPNMLMPRTMSRRRQYMTQQAANSGMTSPLMSPMRMEMFDKKPNSPENNQHLSNSLKEEERHRSNTHEEWMQQLTPRSLKVLESPITNNEEPTEDSIFNAVTPTVQKLIQEQKLSRRRSGGLNIMERTITPDRLRRKRGISLVYWNLCNEDPLRFINPNLDPSVKYVSTLDDKQIAETYNIKIIRGSEASSEANDMISVHIDEKEPDETLEEFVHMIHESEGKLSIPYRCFVHNPLHNPTVKDSSIDIHMTPDDIAKYNDTVMRLIETKQDLNDFVVFRNEWDNITSIQEKLSPQQRTAIQKRNKSSRRYSKALVEMLQRSTSIRREDMRINLDALPQKLLDFSLETCSKNWKIQMKGIRESKANYVMVNSCVYIHDWKLNMERSKSHEKAQALLNLKRTNTV
jgi:hypothetical protein